MNYFKFKRLLTIDNTEVCFEVENYNGDTVYVSFCKPCILGGVSFLDDKEVTEELSTMVINTTILMHNECIKEMELKDPEYSFIIKRDDIE